MLDSVWFDLINILMIGVLTVYLPISGVVDAQKRRSVKIPDKVKDYHSQAIWSLFPVVIILVPTFLGFVTPEALGIKMIDIEHNAIPSVIVYSGIVVFSLHFIYNIYSILMLKFNKKVRDQAAESMSQDVYDFLPVTSIERKAWKIVAVTAGITEELIYRGYLFTIIVYYFSDIPPYLVVAISSLIFGIGHIYQGKDSIRPTVIGLLFGFYYVLLQSIIPLMILHILQDLIAAYVFDEENSKRIRLTTAST